MGHRVVEICDIPFDDIGFRRSVETIVAWARDGSGGYVCTPNVDYVVRSARDPQFRESLLQARLRLPDGMGIVYGARLAGSPLQESVTGRLLPIAVCRAAAAAAIPVGLFGGPPGVAEQAARVLAATTGVEIRCAFGPSMRFHIGSKEDEASVKQVRDASPRILFVALGAPKQEIWMLRNENDLAGCIQVGVGQAFDVLAGRSREAPRWATRVGAEWAFRLAHDPRRLAPRYLREDPKFFWWMLKRRFRRPTTPT
jgi:N-acetylglucosaminyldiphosphoundecaprenol N-acetyl-beta-D-mannosaminyltransferase